MPNLSYIFANRPQKLILAGWFAETFETCEMAQFAVLGYIGSSSTTTVTLAPCLGTDEDIQTILMAYPDASLLLVPDSPRARSRLAKSYEPANPRYSTVISPSSLVSNSSTIGQGCLISHHSIISAGVVLGEHVRVNSGATVMHDAKVSAFSTLAPRCCLLGNVRVGEQSYIGAGAILLPGISVGENCLIGAGAVVTKDVPSGTTVVGVPAKPLKRRSDVV